MEPPSREQRTREFLASLERLWVTDYCTSERLRIFVQCWTASGGPSPPAFPEGLEGAHSSFYHFVSSQEAIRRVLFLWGRHPECRPQALSDRDVMRLHSQYVHSQKGEHQVAIEQEEALLFERCIELGKLLQALRPLYVRLGGESSPVARAFLEVLDMNKTLEKYYSSLIKPSLVPLPLDSMASVESECDNLQRALASLEAKMSFGSVTSLEARGTCHSFLARIIKLIPTLRKLMQSHAFIYIELRSSLAAITGLFQHRIERSLQRELRAPSIRLLLQPWEGSVCILAACSLEDAQRMSVPEILLHSPVIGVWYNVIGKISMSVMSSLSLSRQRLVEEVRNGENLASHLLAAPNELSSDSWLKSRAALVKLATLVQAGAVRTPATITVRSGGKVIKARVDRNGEINTENGRAYASISALQFDHTGHQLSEDLLWPSTFVHRRSLQAYKADHIRRVVSTELLGIPEVWAVKPVSELSVHRLDMIVKSSQPVSEVVAKYSILCDPLIRVEYEPAPVEHAFVYSGEGLRPPQDLQDVGTLGCFCVVSSQHVAITAYHVLQACNIPLACNKSCYTLHTNMTFSILRVSPDTDSALLKVESGVPVCHFPYLYRQEEGEEEEEDGGDDSDDDGEEEDDDDDNDDDHDHDDHDDHEEEEDRSNNGDEDDNDYYEDPDEGGHDEAHPDEGDNEDEEDKNEDMGGIEAENDNILPDSSAKLGRLSIPWDYFAQSLDRKELLCVFKQGSSTGLTHGHLSSVKVAIKNRYGAPIMDAVEITSISSTCFFCEPGDSGALCWVQRETWRIPIAVLIQGPPRAQARLHEQSRAYAVRLDAVVKALGREGEVFSFCPPNCTLHTSSSE